MKRRGSLVGWMRSTTARPHHSTLITSEPPASRTQARDAKEKHDLMTKTRWLAHPSRARAVRLGPALSKGHVTSLATNGNPAGLWAARISVCSVFTSSARSGEGFQEAKDEDISCQQMSALSSRLRWRVLSLTFRVIASSSHSPTPAACTVPERAPCQALSPPALDMQAVERGQSNNNNATINKHNNCPTSHIPAGMAANPSAFLQHSIKTNPRVRREPSHTVCGKTRRR